MSRGYDVESAGRLVAGDEAREKPESHGGNSDRFERRSLSQQEDAGRCRTEGEEDNPEASRRRFLVSLVSQGAADHQSEHGANLRIHARLESGSRKAKRELI